MGIEYRVSGCEPILVAISLWLEVNALYNVHSSNKIKNKNNDTQPKRIQITIETEGKFIPPSTHDCSLYWFNAQALSVENVRQQCMTETGQWNKTNVWVPNTPKPTNQRIIYMWSSWLILTDEKKTRFQIFYLFLLWYYDRMI